MRTVIYQPGGLVTTLDSDLGTAVTRNATGTVLEERPLTDAEIVDLTPPPPTAAALLRAEIAALPAPTMPADVLDVLDRALALLDGA